MQLTRELGIILGFVEIAVVLAVTLTVRRLWQRRSDPPLAAAWERWMAASDPGVGIARVHRVYQHARRGSKAVIVWWRTGRAQDAWFAARQERPGRYVLLRGSVGWGPHNSNPRVLYVPPGGVIATLPARAPQAWLRQQKRLRRQEKRRQAVGHPLAEPPASGTGTP